ncbi:hypothetical protein CICLE_v10010119mg [Citrus x clementina]|uniref:Uncharacterized protein n=1 Tax=Citrus clementina TaxID=85681 RepID=V4UKR8_CITCL|nr:hypothetical protein CICLE_v10010119mg [Citrus x clementina]
MHVTGNKKGHIYHVKNLILLGKSKNRMHCLRRLERLFLATLRSKLVPWRMASNNYCHHVDAQSNMEQP